MSGTAIEIFLKTIATGDGAKKVIADYKEVEKTAKQASKEAADAAKKAAKEQEQAAKQAAKVAQQEARETARVHKSEAAATTVAAKKELAARAAAERAAAQASSSAASQRAQGILAASRGLQDFQAAGMLGLGNNLEGIAMGLGLGTGVSAAVTVLATVVQAAGPEIIKWFQSLDTEGVKLKETQDKLKAYAATLLGEWTPANQAAQDAAAAFTDKINAQKAALEEVNESLKTAADLRKDQLKIEGDIAKDEEAAKIADIQSKNLPKDEEARQIAAVKIARINADKGRAEEVMALDQKNASEKVANTGAAAGDATSQRKALEEEKQRVILQATLAEESAKAEQRIAQAEKDVTAAHGLEGDNREVIQQTEQKLAQEKQRKADLEQEARQNIAANGGYFDETRTVKVIDEQLNQAKQNEAATTKAARDAQFEKNTLDARQFAQRGRLEAEYRRDTGRVTGALPKEQPLRVEHDHGQSDPFEAQERARQQRRENPRNLIAEEQSGGGPRQGLPQDSDLSKVTQSNNAVNASIETFAATVLKDNAATKKRLDELTQKVKDSR